MYMTYHPDREMTKDEKLLYYLSICTRQAARIAQLEARLEEIYMNEQLDTICEAEHRDCIESE